MLGDALTDKSDEIADNTFNVVAPGRGLDSTKLNGDTPVVRYLCIVRVQQRLNKYISVGLIFGDVMM